MPAPLLLVDDDLATIAQVKRLLAREGYEMVLATNAADAVIAWGHHLPPLVLISPKVESDRGRIVLEELRGHPDAQLLHVLLLGETIPGFGYPVAPLPLEPGSFAQTVNEMVRGRPRARAGRCTSPRARAPMSILPSSRASHLTSPTAGAPRESLRCPVGATSLRRWLRCRKLRPRSSRPPMRLGRSACPKSRCRH